MAKFRKNKKLDDLRELINEPGFDSELEWATRSKENVTSPRGKILIDELIMRKRARPEHDKRKRSRKRKSKRDKRKNRKRGTRIRSRIRSCINDSMNILFSRDRVTRS